MKKNVNRIVNSYLDLEAGTYPEVSEAFRTRERQMLIQPKPIKPTKPADPSEPFAKAGEKVWIMNEKGEWNQIPWSNTLEKVRKESC